MTSINFNRIYVLVFMAITLFVCAYTGISLAKSSEKNIKSYLPKENKNISFYIYNNLDVASYKSSLGPRISPKKTTLKDLGLKIKSASENDVRLSIRRWVYRFYNYRRGDFNKDGIEDLKVCLTDESKEGSYSVQKKLLLTQYSHDSPLVAVSYGYDPNGCNP